MHFWPLGNMLTNFLGRSKLKTPSRLKMLCSRWAYRIFFLLACQFSLFPKYIFGAVTDMTKPVQSAKVSASLIRSICKSTPPLFISESASHKSCKHAQKKKSKNQSISRQRCTCVCVSVCLLHKNNNMVSFLSPLTRADLRTPPSVSMATRG